MGAKNSCKLSRAVCEFRRRSKMRSILGGFLFILSTSNRAMTSLPLIKEIQKQTKHGPDLEECENLADSLELELKRHTTDADRTAMLKTLTGLQKSIRAVKRKANTTETKRWKSVLQKIDSAKSLANETQVDEGREEAESSATNASSSSSGLPQSAKEYLSRLQKQNKELYKNPPVMPPGKIVIHDSKCPLPKRDKHHRLCFEAGESSSIEPLLTDFRPNQTPEEVLRGGGFGGTYFRTITSAVTCKTYSGKQALKDTLPNEWIRGMDPKKTLTSATYDESVNKYGVKCGGSLGMWESSGWISEADPYGWFQWYCRFYQGRRCSDDYRQVSRWLKIAGPKGRFKSQLCNKILAAKTNADDASISPVIRQTLFHWGLLVNDEVVEAHSKR